MVTLIDTRATHASAAPAAEPRFPEPVAAPRHPEKAHRPDQPLLRKPDWIRVKAPGSPEYAETRKIVREHGLATVCEEAGCPNIGECWSKRHATMMIMGDTCTRACAFCNVRTGLPKPLDAAEPGRVGAAVAKLGLAHAVITSVDRDDLPDGGAEHFVAVIRAIRDRSPKTTIEILTPDFRYVREAAIIFSPCGFRALRRACPPDRAGKAPAPKPVSKPSRGRSKALLNRVPHLFGR